MEIVIKPQGKLTVPLREIWAKRELIYILALKDLSLRYRHRLIGLIWAILQPLTLALVLTLVLGNLNLSTSIPYPIFILSGLIYWNYFLSSYNRVSASLALNQTLITRIYFPRLIIPLSAMLVGLLDFLFALVVFIGLLIYLKISLTLLGLIILVVALLITFLTSLGFGLILASLLVKYKDIRELTVYFTYLLFFLTPVIYPRAILPASYHPFLYLNPLTGVIEIVRASLFNPSFQTPNLGGLTISIISSLVILTVGLIIFNKIEKELADII